MRTLLATLMALAFACAESDGDPQDQDTDPSDSDTGCTEGAVTPSATGPQLSYASFAVDQPTFTVTAGETVTWTNNDTVPHTVTAGAPGAVVPASAGGFDSGNIASAGKWAYRFCQTGERTYFCKLHSAAMSGFKVVVQ